MADVFIDFSAANDGDGTDAAQAASPGGVGAFNTLTSITWSASDTYWVRRSGTAENLTVDLTPNGVLNGWPKSTDEIYSSRPASGTSAGWDADGDDFAELTLNSSSIEIILSNVTTWNRFQITQNSSNSGNIFTWTADGQTMRHMKLIYTTSGSSNHSTSDIISSDNNILEDIEFEFSGHTNSTTGFRIPTVSGRHNLLKDITFTCGTVGLTATNPFTVSGEGNSIYNMTINVALSISYTSTSNCFVHLNAHNIVNGLDINNSNASYTRYALRTAGSTTIVEKLKITNMAGVYVNNSGCRVEIYDSTLTTAGSINYNHVMNSDNSVLVVDNTTYADAPSTSHFSITGDFCTAVSSNCTTTTTLSTITGDKSNVKEYDLEGIYKIHNQNAFLVSCATARTGGSSFSLRCETFALGAFVPSDFPDQSKLFISLSSGSNDITVYGASKNIDLDSSDIWAEIEYLDGDGLKQRSVTSLSADTSTWTGDSGLTEFKLESTISVSSDQICPVRFIYAPKTYVANAYTYIDPLPVVA